MLLRLLPVAVLAFVVCAKQVVITVGGNTTDNPGAVFQPRTVAADQGDVVLFNFTQGNHTAIQALFAHPCIPAHEVDETINSFHSGFRDAGNFSAVTTLAVTITDPNNTIWFYDYNTCGLGGVGGINVNESGWETTDGFTRNAVRLNGTEASSSFVASPTSTRSSGTANSRPTTASSADHAVVLGAAMVVPLLLALAGLSLSL